jgi:hypothetical protein
LGAEPLRARARPFGLPSLRLYVLDSELRVG